MQDRLKFRVWDKDAKEYLTLYEEDEKTGMHSYWIGWDNTGVYQYDRDVERDIVFITDISQFVELEQCTGLKDKNGRLIYEGDCLGGVLEGCHIAWCPVCKSFQPFFTPVNECAACGGDVHWCDIVEDDGKLEVIGNIHENPELLEA